jgi:hypothetical protein
MPRLCATAALLTALTLIASQGALAISPFDATAPTETCAEHPLRAVDGKQQFLPPPEHEGVIPPPPTGDEGIYTDAPNPEAGHEKEVIPPPDTPSKEPTHGRAIQRLL